jgi:hypothetical protein
VATKLISFFFFKTRVESPKYHPPLSPLLSPECYKYEGERLLLTLSYGVKNKWYYFRFVGSSRENGEGGEYTYIRRISPKYKRHKLFTIFQIYNTINIDAVPQLITILSYSSIRFYWIALSFAD